MYFFKNGDGLRYVKLVASIYQEGAASTTKSIIHTDKEERMILSSITLFMIQKYLLY